MSGGSDPETVVKHGQGDLAPAQNTLIRGNRHGSDADSGPGKASRLRLLQRLEKLAKILRKRHHWLSCILQGYEVPK